MPEHSRTELGRFLRSRRERLDPATVGLPVGPRRRATGLRREEVALLAHVSPSWYTYLEQGRKIHPSAEVLDGLATALRLDRAERRYLHALAAGPATSVLPASTPDPDALASIRALVDTSSAMPYPVYAVDARGGLVGWNAHMAEWYDDFSGRTGRDLNMGWWLLTSPQARERIADWHTDAREFVARVRFFVGTNRFDAAAEAMIKDLCAASVEVAQWWQTYDVVEQQARNRSFHHPRLGLRTLQLVVVRPSVSPAVSIIFHVPPTAP